MREGPGGGPEPAARGGRQAASLHQANISTPVAAEVLRSCHFNPCPTQVLLTWFEIEQI